MEKYENETTLTNRRQMKQFRYVILTNRERLPKKIQRTRARRQKGEKN